jgi:sugar lactone lactonase YvrE
VHHAGHLYAADSALGLIWRVSDAGGTPEIWASGEELAQVGGGLPGPNGLKLFGGEMYVSNPSPATIVAIEVAPDGSAGAFRTHATDVFCDDFAFDVHGTLYCRTDPFNTLVRIAPDGSAGKIGSQRCSG